MTTKFQDYLTSCEELCVCDVCSESAYLIYHAETWDVPMCERCIKNLDYIGLVEADVETQYVPLRNRYPGLSETEIEHAPINFNFYLIYMQHCLNFYVSTNNVLWLKFYTIFYGRMFDLGSVLS
jgi:hypothetical protein